MNARPATKNLRLLVLPREACTHPTRFGFTAGPAGYLSNGAPVFVVSEDGVVWQADIEESCPITDWKKAHIGKAELGWARRAE